MRTGFDNDKYLKIQSEHIKERIGKFGDKLYLEFGGKLFKSASGISARQQASDAYAAIRCC